MILAPQNSRFGWEAEGIKWLLVHLCQSPSPSFPDKEEHPDVIRLILDSAALLTIVGTPGYFDYRGAVIRQGTAILAAIISHLGRRLADPATRDNGQQMFASLARTEVKGPEGDIYTWDLGEWLRTTAPEILRRTPSSTDSMRDVHDSLSAIYPTCEQNPELRATWDRIGYSGPSADMAYLLDPYPDLGEFFASAEDPLSRSGV